MKTMRVRVSTPARELVLGPLVALRFLAQDGWRGVLAGHEPATAVLRPGPVRCLEPRASPRGEDRLSWLATEGGVLLIDQRELKILSDWAATATTLTELRGLVEARDAERRRIETEARALSLRHELATRRALVALERKVSLP